MTATPGGATVVPKACSWGGRCGGCAHPSGCGWGCKWFKPQRPFTTTQRSGGASTTGNGEALGVLRESRHTVWAAGWDATRVRGRS